MPSRLQGVSTLDLGQDTVMRAADQEVVQPVQRAEFKPSSTVGLPSDMPRHVYEVWLVCLPVHNASLDPYYHMHDHC